MQPGKWINSVTRLSRLGGHRQSVLSKFWNASAFLVLLKTLGDVLSGCHLCLYLKYCLDPFQSSLPHATQHNTTQQRLFISNARKWWKGIKRGEDRRQTPLQLMSPFAWRIHVTPTSVSLVFLTPLCLPNVSLHLLMPFALMIFESSATDSRCVRCFDCKSSSLKFSGDFTYLVELFFEKCKMFRFEVFYSPRLGFEYRM